ncbi:MAG: hypothetical protein K6A38_07455 [Lachnospiraceae bacterium]|nr:hypothetical protein [Lachnospiraceae bacterium]
MDLFDALFQAGAVPLWSVEIWAALVAAGVVMIAMKLYRQMEDALDHEVYTFV